jgi:hypothetical protein
VKILTISRKLWARGGEPKNTLYTDLLNTNGTMCCLGFAAKQLCGADYDDIRRKGQPRSVPRVFMEKLRWLLGVKPRSNSRDARALMVLNDKVSIDEKARENGIAAIFKKHGVRVRFVQ